MQQNPPPIQWLPVFEAAARLLSFKKAAEELCVTPPAISQQIKVLEEYLEVRLFDRQGRKLRLTAAGEFYYEATSDIIKRHTKSYRELERKFRHPVLAISTPIFIAQELLIPNYNQFKEYAPNVELRITTGNQYVDFEDEPVDIALRFGTGNWPGLQCRFVHDIDVKFVCSQSYLVKNALSEKVFIEKEDFNDHTVISLYDDLRDWRTFSPNIQPKQKIVCDTYFSAVRSAEEGLGIGIGLFPIINRTVRERRLLTLNTDKATTDNAYWLVAPKNTLPESHFDAVYRWLSALFESIQ